jgi:hypothetical protein
VRARLLELLISTIVTISNSLAGILVVFSSILLTSRVVQFVIKEVLDGTRRRTCRQMRIRQRKPSVVIGPRRHENT